MGKTTFGGTDITLKDGETIIWQGRPAQGIIRNPISIGFGLVLLALGLWLTLGGYGPLAGAGAMLGLPVVGIGLFLAYFHPKIEKNRRADTYYGLTNRRALLAYGRRRRTLAYPILAKSRIQLKKGRYDIVFFAVDRQLGVQQGSSRRRVGFGHLQDGNEVYNLMLDIQKQRIAEQAHSPA